MCLVFSESDRQHINLNKATAKKEELKYLSEVWKIVAKFPEAEVCHHCHSVQVLFLNRRKYL
jgi:aspartate-semialdehyde dehydrogenase